MSRRQRARSLPFVAADRAPKRKPFDRLLEHQLESDLALARQMGSPLGVFVLRIEHKDGWFDGLADEARDLLLDDVASRLRQAAGPADRIMRFRDDGFVIIQPAGFDLFAARQLARTILASLRPPLRMGAWLRSLDISIGIASYPNDGNTACLLLSNGYAALKRAERWGGNGFCLFSPMASKALADGLVVDEDLRRAMRAEALEMRFKPILDVDRACMGAVAGELTWQHPARGLMTYADILPSAERAGVLARLNEWMVTYVCRQAGLWRHRGLHRRVCLDVSRAQVADSHLAVALAAALEQASLPAHLIELSIDHRVLLDDTDHRLRTGLRHLADLGVDLTASNVGNGPLPFHGLANLPIHNVELAPSMIAAIGRCSDSEVTLAALIAFLQGLSLRVRAAGTAADDQLDFLRNHQCDEVTGPLLAPALGAAEIDRLTGIEPCFMQQQWLAGSKPRLLSMH